MDNSLTDIFELFLSEYYEKDITKLELQYPAIKSLFVDFFDLDNFNSDITQQLLESPDMVLSALNEALNNRTNKDNLNIRIINNPYIKKIGNIRHDHIGKLVSFSGLVLKATEVRPRFTKAAFECPLCAHITFFKQTNPRRLIEPTTCEECKKNITKFKIQLDLSEFTDSQKIRLQEPLEDLRGGAIPATKDVELEGDLAGMVSPGDRLSVNGILRSELKIVSGLKLPIFEVYIEANSIEIQDKVFDELKITDDDEREVIALSKRPNIYNVFISNIAPSIYGLSKIKEALLLQLFSGVPKHIEDGTTIRGDIHVLLVGDPGLGKSQLLTSVVNLAPRGLFTAGSSSTAAGLTAAAVRDEFNEGSWSLEAGALVLADMGFTAVDELDKMSKHDRAAIHEAMEQQQVSIAKAGIVATLHSRCALLAAANPISGRFDPYEPIAKQINMPPTLLSRFDLIFMMLDKSNEEMDTKLAQHVLKTHKQGGKKEKTKDNDTNHGLIEPSLIRKYIAYSRKIKPKLSDAVMSKFQDFYVQVRQDSRQEDAAIPITVRQLESLVRLGEASARTRLSNTVTEEDADRVLTLFLHCMKTVYTDPESGNLDIDWVVSGTSKTKRDRATTIRTIIQNIEKDFGMDIPIIEILDHAEEEGIERNKAEDVLEAMKRDGILFSPSPRIVRFVR